MKGNKVVTDDALVTKERHPKRVVFLPPLVGVPEVEHLLADLNARDAGDGVVVYMEIGGRRILRVEVRTLDPGLKPLALTENRTLEQMREDGDAP